VHLKSGFGNKLIDLRKKNFRAELWRCLVLKKKLLEACFRYFFAALATNSRLLKTFLLLLLLETRAFSWCALLQLCCLIRTCFFSGNFFCIDFQAKINFRLQFQLKTLSIELLLWGMVRFLGMTWFFNSQWKGSSVDPDITTVASTSAPTYFSPWKYEVRTNTGERWRWQRISVWSRMRLHIHQVRTSHHRQYLFEIQLMNITRLVLLQPECVEVANLQRCILQKLIPSNHQELCRSSPFVDFGVIKSFEHQTARLVLRNH